MAISKLIRLALLPLLALQSYAQIESIEELPEDDILTQAPNPPLDVNIDTYFPSAEIFGIKLVNGHATSAVLSIANLSPTSILVRAIGGSLNDPQTGLPIRNLTATQYNIEVPGGTNQSLTYNFATELHPRDLDLRLAALITKDEFAYQVAAFNGTVSVVEAPISLLDPQMIFLYLLLSSLFAGTCYFIYTTWIATLFPQKAGRGKGGERAKTSSRGTKVVDPSAQVAVGGADGPAVASAADSDWIPAQHLKRPEARRVGSGRSGMARRK